MAWLYVPALEVSNEGLNQELMDSKPFVMLRGKPMQLRTLLRKYKKEPYMKLLSGLTFKPSMANLGVAKWILSLGDSLVNPIQVRGSYLEKKTRETYGRTLNESLARFHPGSYSWRTFQTSIIQSAPQSLETWPKWGLTRRGALYALPTLAHPIEERDGLSWPTPTVNQVTRNYQEPIEKYLQRVEDYKQGKTKGKPGVSLGVKVRMMIPTPTTQTNQTCESMNHSKAHRNLKKLLMTTPTASDGIRTNLTYGAGNLTLKGHVVKYPTPTASEAEKAGYYSKGQMGNSLVAQAKREGLKTGGRLNPQWVEWLMGWPIGWTDLEGAGTE